MRWECAFFAISQNYVRIRAEAIQLTFDSFGISIISSVYGNYNHQPPRSPMQLMQFQIGDKVVYPNQGVGIVEQISTRNLTGQPEMFYLLKIGATSMRVMVPLSSVANVGLRRVTKTSQITSILDYLQKGRCKSAGDWKGRFKENSEKMRSGSLMQVAEVDRKS